MQPYTLGAAADCLLQYVHCCAHLSLPAELRAAINKERKSGKAPPKRLSSHQRQIVESLIQRHGDNIEVWC